MNWISVEDKQPPKDKAFLAAIIQQVDILWYDEKDKVFKDYHYKQTISSFKYWMPLPQAPKQ